MFVGNVTHLRDSTALTGVFRQVHDAGMQTFDRAVIDGTGLFLTSQLERIDPVLYAPLVQFTWSRDVDVREDITLADDVASYTVSSFAAPGGVVPDGINWIGRNSNAIPGPAVDLGRVSQPLHLWGQELSWTVIELEKSMKLGTGIDQQKLEAMRLKYNMDVDQMVYVGDSNMGVTGLVNSQNRAGVTLRAATGKFTTLTADQRRADLNGLIGSVYDAAGNTMAPTRLLVPPGVFGDLAGQQLPNTGETVLSFLRRTGLSTEVNNRPLEIYPCKWLKGAGVGGTDRIVAYTKGPDRVRIPLTQLDRTPLEYRSLYQMVTYYGALGQIEILYPETVGYLDGV